MIYYLEPDSHVRYKFKAVLNSSSYGTEKGSDHDTGVDTADLAAKKIFFWFKSWSNIMWIKFDKDPLAADQNRHAR